MLVCVVGVTSHIYNKSSEIEYLRESTEFSDNSKSFVQAATKRDTIDRRMHRFSKAKYVWRPEGALPSDSEEIKMAVVDQTNFKRGTVNRGTDASQQKVELPKRCEPPGFSRVFDISIDRGTKKGAKGWGGEAEAGARQKKRKRGEGSKTSEWSVDRICARGRDRSRDPRSKYWDTGSLFVGIQPPRTRAARGTRGRGRLAEIERGRSKQEEDGAERWIRGGRGKLDEDEEKGEERENEKERREKGGRSFKDRERERGFTLWCMLVGLHTKRTSPPPFFSVLPLVRSLSLSSSPALSFCTVPVR